MYLIEEVFLTLKPEMSFCWSVLTLNRRRSGVQLLYFMFCWVVIASAVLSPTQLLDVLSSSLSLPHSSLSILVKWQNQMQTNSWYTSTHVQLSCGLCYNGLWTWTFHSQSKYITNKLILQYDIHPLIIYYSKLNIYSNLTSSTRHMWHPWPHTHTHTHTHTFIFLLWKFWFIKHWSVEEVK